MMYELEIKKNHVAYIRLNRPEVHNAFNDEFIDELIKIVNELNARKDVRILVLTGNGKSFCAGADLNWMKKMKDYSFSENLEDSKKLMLLFKTINEFNKPVVGLINGPALGGGVGLVAVCDYVLAVDTAKFGLTEVRLGLIPAVISPFVIAKIGESNARATFLSGGRFNAARALSMGLIHQVTSFDKMDEDLDEVLKDFLQAAPKAQIKAKNLIFKVKSMLDDESVHQFTTNEISKLRCDSEGQEGMSALLEKRNPNWN
jgi:methylglutaconyl-CoA hydratase